MTIRQYRLVLPCLVALLALIHLPGVTEAKPVAKEAGASKAANSAKPRVAVLYFDYSGKDEDLGFLRKGMTQMLVTDLSNNEELVVVERTDLEAVLGELELNRSKQIDRASANRVGKLLGARYLITGGYFVFKGKIRVDAKIIDVERGTTVGVGAQRDMEDFLVLEIALVEKLQAKLFAVHSSSSKAAQRTRKRTNLPRPNKVATRTVARYGKALDAIDQGDKKVAMKELAKITKDSPDFKPAADELKVLLR